MKRIQLSTLAMLTVFTACGQAKFTNVGYSNNVSTNSTSSASTCTNNVLDYGQKQSLATAVKGAFSATKIIPGTTNPATAYFDASTNTIKYAYWNGSRYVIETVAGETSVTGVRLVFLSSGFPLVFWINHAAAAATGPVKMAGRTAVSTDSTGVWNAGVIDLSTTTTNRALEVSVSPNDKVVVVYETNTGGLARFVGCDSGCGYPSAYTAMAAGVDITGGAVGTGAGNIGVAWCKASSSTYYPAVVYGGSVTSMYGICQASPLSNCLTSASWTKVALTGSGTNAPSSSLYMDPTVIGDVPKALTKPTASSLSVYTMGATACTAAPVALTSAQTVGGANTGNAWSSLLKDSSGKFHIVANESTTNVRYFNSTTTDPTAAWNAVGPLDTVTLPAVGVGQGEAAITSANTLFTSYGPTTGVYNLVMGMVTNTAVSSALAVFSTTVPDTAGSIINTVGVTELRTVSSASTSAGNPAVAYVDFSTGAIASGKLKYTYRNGTSATSPWVSTLIPGPISPAFPSLAFDASNLPWISYFESSTNRYYLMTNTSSDGTGYWTAFQFPDYPTGTYTLPATNDTALAMYYAGGVAYPVMMVLDNTNATSQGLKSALLNPATGLWNNIYSNTPVFSFVAANKGYQLTTDYNTSGKIVVSFFDVNTSKVTYMHTPDGGASWTSSYTVSASAAGAGAVIKLNPVTGSPAIAYYDQPNNRVYYAPCSGTPATCATGGWTPTMIEYAAGVSGLTTSTSQLLQANLDFSSTGYAHVSYPVGAGNSGNYMHISNASGSFSTAVIRAAGSNAATSSAPVVNFAVAGWSGSSTRTSLGEYFSAYVGPGGYLYSSSCSY